MRFNFDGIIDNAILIPVYQENNHIIKRNISFIYAYILDSQEEIIFNKSHNDFPINKFPVLGKNIYVYNSYFNKEVDAVFWLTQTPHPQLNNWRGYIDVCYNDYIPGAFHIKNCRRIKDSFVNSINFLDKSLYDIFCENIVDSYRWVEQCGIYLKNHPTLGTGVKNTRYNLYTRTGRPSNSFDGYNYSAIPKGSEREFFVSRFDSGFLVEYDFNAYHLRLIANLIGYKFPEENIHLYLGKQYFKKSVLTDHEYKESKILSFKELYNGFKGNLDIDFFKRSSYFSDYMFDFYNRNKYLKTPIIKRKLNVEKPEQNILFNHYIQAYETERNALIIKQIKKQLSGYKSVLSLCNYDSFLFDIHPEEQHITKEIEKILSSDEMVFSKKQGLNYNFNNIS
jgi:hypothetical protein